MEAALRGMTSTGGEVMLQLLKNSGHGDVASMLTAEGSGPWIQKRVPYRATGEGVQLAVAPVGACQGAAVEEKRKRAMKKGEKTGVERLEETCRGQKEGTGARGGVLDGV